MTLYTPVMIMISLHAIKIPLFFICAIRRIIYATTKEIQPKERKI